MTLLEKRLRPEKWFGSDERFDLIYPSSIRALAIRHWTPLKVARKVADFLATQPGCRILDIGSGVGKFSLAAAYFQSHAFYYGIEQRKHLITHAETARDILRLRNVFFTHGNFTQLDFRNFDHFYFYNAFYEN